MSGSYLLHITSKDGNIYRSETRLRVESLKTAPRIVAQYIETHDLDAEIIKQIALVGLDSQRKPVNKSAVFRALQNDLTDKL